MSTETIKGTQMLREAIIDAERLLSHASEYGIELDQKYIKAIVGAKKNNQINEWTEQDEIDFWSAFQVLSKSVLPVTIDSLRASSLPPEPKKTWWNTVFGTKKKSLVERSVSFYRWFALIAMIIMLIIQIYSLIGTALMSKYNAGNTRMMEIEQRMQSLVLITASNPDDRSANMERDNLEMENEELAKEVESGIYLLKDWLDVTANLWSQAIEIYSEKIAENKSSQAGTPISNTHATSENIVVVQKAKSLIIILNQYILPLLYGLLGGIAFVLRSIAHETKEMTYTPTSKIKYGLRVHLGALAGLVIGFLWGDFQGKSFGVVESLSPLAVAFLAGYSVEFLFRMLDSVIGTTGSKAAEAAGGNSEKKNE